MIKALTLENLKQLDMNKVGLVFNKHLQRMGEDCVDRPGDGSARKVILEVSITPVTDDRGNADTVKVSMKCTSKAPPMVTRDYSMGLQGNGIMAFSKESPENFHQTTLMDNDPDDEDDD